MTQSIKFIGLDVHKKSISIAIANQARDAEVRYYGKMSEIKQKGEILHRVSQNNLNLLCFV